MKDIGHATVRMPSGRGAWLEWCRRKRSLKLTRVTESSDVEAELVALLDKVGEPVVEGGSWWRCSVAEVGIEARRAAALGKAVTSGVMDSYWPKAPFFIRLHNVPRSVSVWDRDGHAAVWVDHRDFLEVLRRARP